MKVNKGTALLLLVVMLAFTWGYKRDAIERLFSGDETPGPASPSTGGPPPAAPVQGVPAAQPPGAVSPATIPPAGPQGSLAGGMISPPGAQPGFVGLQPAVSPVPLNAPSQAPDAALHPAPKSYLEYLAEQSAKGNPENPENKNSLANTLDSIRPGQVDSAQVDRRNAYFEKLSQQLQELKGEPPPRPTQELQPPAEGVLQPPVNPYAPYMQQGAAPFEPPGAFPGAPDQADPSFQPQPIAPPIAPEALGVPEEEPDEDEEGDDVPEEDEEAGLDE